jgi:hypothetical protein
MSMNSSDELEMDEVIKMLLGKANRRILKLLQHVYIAGIVKIVAPLQYACLHTFAYLGWNSKHFVDFDEMEEEEFFTGLYWMLIMFAVSSSSATPCSTHRESLGGISCRTPSHRTPGSCSRPWSAASPSCRRRC